MISALTLSIGNTLKKEGKHILQYTNADNIVPNSIAIYLLKGLLILYKNNSPVIVVRITLILLSSSYERSNISEKHDTSTMLNNTVNAAGSAFENIFIMKFPFTIDLLGSNASKKDGAPIVNAVINVNCIGMKKYFCEDKILNTISNIV